MIIDKLKEKKDGLIKEYEDQQEKLKEKEARLQESETLSRPQVGVLEAEVELEVKRLTFIQKQAMTVDSMMRFAND